MDNQQEISQQIPPQPPIQAPIQPPLSNVNKFPWIRILAIVLIVAALLGVGGYILVIRKNQLPIQPQPLPKQQNPNSASLNNLSPLSANLFQPQNLADKVVYAVQKEDKQTIYVSDYSGNQTQIATISAVENSTSLSPDRTKLLYEKKGDLHLYMHDFSLNKDSSYLLSNDNNANIGDLKWNSNSKEIIFTLVTNTIKVDPNALSHTPSPKIYQLGLLNIDTGTVQMIDLSNTPMAGEVNLPGLTYLLFYASSKPFLYIFESSLCDPGPCYSAMYSFDWQTHAIKKFQLPDSIKGLIGSVNPATGEFLIGDHGLDVLVGDQTHTGYLQVYNPIDNSIKTLLSKIGYGFSVQDASFIDDHTILYSQAKLPTQAANPPVPPPVNWYILDLNTNGQKQIPYTGGNLKPLSQNVGIVQTQSYQDFELDLINLTTGVVTNLYKSKDTDYSFLQ